MAGTTIMPSDQQQSSLFGEARRAELEAIEEQEFQMRLKARNERKREKANAAGTNSDRASEAHPSLDDVRDDLSRGVTETRAEDHRESTKTVSKPSGQVVSPQQQRQYQHRTKQAPSSDSVSSNRATSTHRQDIQVSKKLSTPSHIARLESHSTAHPLPMRAPHVEMTSISRITTVAGSSKRFSPVSCFNDDRRQQPIKRPKPTAVGSTATTSLGLREDVDPLDAFASATVSDERPPKWYRELKRDKTRTRGDSNVDVLLVTLRTWIKKVQKPSQSKAEAFNEVRGRIHKIAFLPVNPKLLKSNWMLDNQDGLPLIFDDRYRAGVTWPWDIKADAEELYNKWCRGIFETDLLRGILAQKFGNNRRDSERLDPNYKGRAPANYHGNGDLLNGQWWPTRLAMLRDGAHGETQAGISGAEGKGAFACVMSGGLDHDGKEYPDEDHGDWILYCGTDNTGDDVKVTAATQRMIESVGKEPVRLIRSSDVRSPFAPEIGYRYDGLYKVVSVRRLDPRGAPRQRHQFMLERVQGQNPLRGGDGPEKRPTAEEVDAYQKMQKGFRGDSSI